MSTSYENSPTFNWQETADARPVFAVDYWPGVPAREIEGRQNIASDLEHIKAYADPVLVRSFAFSLGHGSEPLLECPQRASYDVPDLIHEGSEHIARWQERVATEIRPLVEQYRRAGMQCVDLSTLALISGHCSAPGWYRTVPDWEECDLRGTPLSSTGRQPPMACLVHPTLYEIIDRFWAAVSFLKDTGVLLGACVENEPHLHHHDLSDFGGNPYTRKAFQVYLRESFGAVERFNRTSGRAYSSFDEVDIGHENWLVRAMAARFRATLVCGRYQNEAARLAKKHIPELITITRLETSYYLREDVDGREAIGVDLTYLDPGAIDVMAWSHSTRPGADGDLLGGMHVTGCLVRGPGLKIGITEPHVQRYGAHWSPYRPDELLHLIYRGLYFNFRFFNLHTWERTGGGKGAVLNEPVGASYKQRAGVLAMVRTLRGELGWIRPFSTFGKHLLPEFRILVSRSARSFPGMGGSLYGNWLADLCHIVEHPEYSCYEIVEECTSILTDSLLHAKGIVCMDACLADATRSLLNTFVQSGGKLLVIGAPAYVGPMYEPAEVPAVYPITGIEAVDFEKLADRKAPAGVVCATSANHPIWPSVAPMVMADPQPLSLRDGAQCIARDGKGRCVAAANENVVYLSAPLVDRTQQSQLLGNFQRWNDVVPPEIIISRYEEASVAQNYDSRNVEVDGSVIDRTPWHGEIPLSGTARGRIRELREDVPWLAYHVAGDDTHLESVCLRPLDVRVFRWEAGTSEPIHLEGLPPSVGVSRFWQGDVHPIIARFSVQSRSRVSARVVVPDAGSDEFGWYVCPVGNPSRVAEAAGSDVSFEVEAECEYYLVVVRLHHEQFFQCPLCTKGLFE